MYNNQKGVDNKFIKFKYGIFMETDVENDDIDAEVKEINRICANSNCWNKKSFNKSWF